MRKLLIYFCTKNKNPSRAKNMFLNWTSRFGRRPQQEVEAGGLQYKTLELAAPPVGHKTAVLPAPDLYKATRSRANGCNKAAVYRQQPDVFE